MRFNINILTFMLFRVPDFRFQVSGFKFQVPNSVNYKLRTAN